ncbi:MAG: YdcF family protein [Acetobacteraceae bacterium]|nr:YdcF family protein [Acetobacteraceae bacterium]MBV8520880.1 YdcF family protein [Acetobacteraceae bacterium]
MSEEAMIGTDGLATFALSCAVIASTLGTSFAAALAYVVGKGVRTRTTVSHPARILVLGMRLSTRGVLRARYRTRLERAYSLWKASPDAEIVVLGGQTRPAARSEAEAGRNFLISAGVPGCRIRTEDRSRHTLENLGLYRRAFAAEAPVPAPLVTSRFHIARASIMASGLGLAHRPCPAEANPLRLMQDLHLLVWEAFLVHWYLTGRT